MAFSFEKLLVYQKAVNFADAICEKTEQFTRGYGYCRECAEEMLRIAEAEIDAIRAQISEFD